MENAGNIRRLSSIKDRLIRKYRVEISIPPEGSTSTYVTGHYQDEFDACVENIKSLLLPPVTIDNNDIDDEKANTFMSTYQFVCVVLCGCWSSFDFERLLPVSLPSVSGMFVALSFSCIFRLHSLDWLHPPSPPPFPLSDVLLRVSVCDNKNPVNLARLAGPFLRLLRIVECYESCHCVGLVLVLTSVFVSVFLFLC
jgi:hypothetical protein